MLVPQLTGSGKPKFAAERARPSRKLERILEVGGLVNRDRTDRIPRGDDVPEEGAGRPRRDRRPHQISRDQTSAPDRFSANNSGPWETDIADVDRYIDERADEPPTSRASRRPLTGTASGPTRTADSSPEAFIPPSAPGRSNVRRDTADPGWREDTAPPRQDQPRTPRRGGEDDENEEGGLSAPAVSRPPTRRAASRSRSRGPAGPAPSLPRPRIPAAIAKADLVNDPLALALIGVETFGLLVMATIMGNRLGTLVPVLELRFDAVGSPYRWGVPRTLWNLPLLATMITLMNVAVAWFVSPHDRFASRFCIAAALVVQLLVWVPVVRFLW